MSAHNQSASGNGVAGRRGKVAGQTIALFSSQMGVLALGVITGSMVTRALGSDAYGRYSFAMASVVLIDGLLGFGLSSAGARLLATADSGERQKGLVGALAVAGLSQGLIVAVVVLTYSRFVDGLFGTSVGPLMLLGSVGCAAVSFEQMFVQMCRGTNRIGLLAAYTLGPKLVFTILGFGMIRVGAFSAETAVLLNYLSAAVGCALGFWSIRPSFRDLRGNLRRILKETREYGLHIYFGQIADTTTYKLDSTFIASYSNTRMVGFYSLAQTLVSPMANLSRSLAVALFRGFASAPAIDSKIFRFNGLFLGIAFACVILMGDWVVALLFGPEYQEVGRFLLPLGLAGVFQGIYSPINMFLAAHRKGRELRGIAFLVGGMNLAGFCILVPRMGALGAAYVAVCSKFAEMVLNVYHYRRFTRGSSGPPLAATSKT